MGNNAVLIIFVADIVITTTTKWHLPTSTAQPRKDNIIFLGRQASVNHWTLLTVQAVQEYSFIYLHSLQNILPDSVLRVINILFNCTYNRTQWASNINIILYIQSSSSLYIRPQPQHTAHPASASTPHSQPLHPALASTYILPQPLHPTLSLYIRPGLLISTSSLTSTPVPASTSSLSLYIQPKPQPLNPAPASHTFPWCFKVVSFYFYCTNVMSSLLSILVLYFRFFPT